MVCTRTLTKTSPTRRHGLGDRSDTLGSRAGRWRTPAGPALLLVGHGITHPHNLCDRIDVGWRPLVSSCDPSRRLTSRAGEFVFTILGTSGPGPDARRGGSQSIAAAPRARSLRSQRRAGDGRQRLPARDTRPSARSSTRPASRPATRTATRAGGRHSTRVATRPNAYSSIKLANRSPPCRARSQARRSPRHP